MPTPTPIATLSWALWADETGQLVCADAAEAVGDAEADEEAEEFWALVVFVMVKFSVSLIVLPVARSKIAWPGGRMKGVTDPSDGKHVSLPLLTLVPLAQQKVPCWSF